MLRIPEIAESVRIAFNALRANITRAALTTLGIVVGIFLVVIIGWALAGLNSVWDHTISILGKDMIYIDKWSWAGGGSWRKALYRKNISLSEIERLAERMVSAEMVIPMGRRWRGSVSYAGRRVHPAINGTSWLYGQTPGGETQAGRFFSAIDEVGSDRVVVIGHGVAKTLFGGDNALGEVIRIGKVPFRIIGVISKQGILITEFVDNQVYIPMPHYISLFGAQQSSFSAAVKAGSPDLLDMVRFEARGLMRDIRSVHPSDEDDFSINEMKAFDQQIQTIRYSIWGAGLGLTLLSFVVGAIGIMNIMFVSVTERTREIGIRKAVGARRTSIMMQFLVESSFLCIAGAFIALPLSQGVISLLKWIIVHVLEFEAGTVISPVIPPQIVVLALAVSLFVGVLAGVFPAIRAARLDPVTALRQE